MKKNKTTIKSIDLGFLPIEIVYVIGDWDSCIRKLKKSIEGDWEFNVPLDHQVALTCYKEDLKLANGNQLVMLWFKGKGKLSSSQVAGIVAHEAVHASHAISDLIGTIFNSAIQEPQAYLVQRITQDILYYGFDI